MKLLVCALMGTVKGLVFLQLETLLSYARAALKWSWFSVGILHYCEFPSDWEFLTGRSIYTGVYLDCVVF